MTVPPEFVLHGCTHTLQCKGLQTPVMIGLQIMSNRLIENIILSYLILVQKTGVKPKPVTSVSLPLDNTFFLNFPTGFKRTTLW